MPQPSRTVGAGVPRVSGCSSMNRAECVPREEVPIFIAGLCTSVVSGSNLSPRGDPKVRDTRRGRLSTRGHGRSKLGSLGRVGDRVSGQCIYSNGSRCYDIGGGSTRPLSRSIAVTGQTPNIVSCHWSSSVRTSVGGCSCS